MSERTLAAPEAVRNHETRKAEGVEFHSPPTEPAEADKGAKSAQG